MYSDDDQNVGIAWLGCAAQIPAFFGGLVALVFWFNFLWWWLGLFWAIVGTIILGWIPTAVTYWILILVFGPLIAFGSTKLGRSGSGQFFIGAFATILALIFLAFLALVVYGTFF